MTTELWRLGGAGLDLAVSVDERILCAESM
jgi:hypothetical protein